MCKFYKNLDYLTLFYKICRVQRNRSRASYPLNMSPHCGISVRQHPEMDLEDSERVGQKACQLYIYYMYSVIK